MNLLQIATAIGYRCGAVQDRDITACKTFLGLRHDQLYRSRLFKDSVIEYVVPISSSDTYVPTSVYMPTKGVLILPTIFQHVIAARTSEHKLDVQRQMLYYRVDENTFAKTGVPLEFFLLSACVWEMDDDSFPLSIITDNAADVALSATLGLLNSDGVSIDRNAITLDTNSVSLADSDRIDEILKVATTGTVTVRALGYPNDAETQTDINTIPFGISQPMSVLDTSGLVAGDTIRIIGTDIATQTEARFTYSVDIIDSATAFHGTYLNASGDSDDTHVIFTGADVFLLTQQVIVTLTPTQTGAIKRQRIRLVNIPDTATTIRVLGKRTTPPFSANTDVPGVSGMEGALLALGYYDMLLRDERGGTAEAQMALQEATALLEQLEAEEVVQGAHNTRILPESGFGPDEFAIGPQF